VRYPELFFDQYERQRLGHDGHMEKYHPSEWQVALNKMTPNPVIKTPLYLQHPEMVGRVYEAHEKWLTDPKGLTFEKRLRQCFMYGQYDPEMLGWVDSPMVRAEFDKWLAAESSKPVEPTGLLAKWGLSKAA
jgi:hypothetical protein